jgi:toxin ParE1/3/4
MVIWSKRARADLKLIHDHIAEESPANAKAVAREILRRANTIESAPFSGRMVPEMQDERVREVPSQ